MATTNTNQQEGSGSGTGKRKPVFVKANELKPGTKGHNLIVKVVSSTTVLDKKSFRNSGNTRIAECLIGDDTASILFTARNDQGLFISFYICCILQNLYMIFVILYAIYLLTIGSSSIVNLEFCVFTVNFLMGCQFWIKYTPYVQCSC